MYVRRVELTDFRSYERVAVDFDPGVAVLVGQNGMGKTNLIEALGYVATLDSHRVATDVVTDVPAVIASWQQGTVIRSWLLDLMVNALKEDDDLSALRGYAEDSGEGRWTVEAAVDHAVPLPVITAALSPHLTKAYDAVAAGRSTASIAYASRLGESLVPDRPQLEQALLASLAERRQNEVERGVTLVGPHRDDLSLTLGELPAKGYASHGESWSFALALRLAAYDLLRADGIEPVLVLDDVFAELDSGRRERLAALVSDATQLLVTCAVPEDVPATLRGARYDVGSGTVTRV